MTVLLLVCAAWLLLTLPTSVLLGRCIAVGQAGETERHAADAARGELTPAAGPSVPAQRQPTGSRSLVS